MQHSPSMDTRVGKAQACANITVLVLTEDELNMQTFNLRDTVTECQNAAYELLATLIQASTNQEALNLLDYAERCKDLIKNVFVAREPQTEPSLVIDFETRDIDTDSVSLVQLTFICKFDRIMSSVIYASGGANVYAQ